MMMGLYHGHYQVADASPHLLATAAGLTVTDGIDFATVTRAAFMGLARR